MSFVKQKVEERKFNEGRRHKSIRTASKVFVGEKTGLRAGKAAVIEECTGMLGAQDSVSS